MRWNLPPQLLRDLVKGKGMSDKEIKIKLKRSLIGSKAYQKKSVKGLGLSKVGQIVLVKDTPENRGMINKAIHLLELN